MDEFKELEKYKNLLDTGVITEEDFRVLKQKLLGLKTDEEKAMEREQERVAAMAEIEALRAEKKAEEEKLLSEQRRLEAKEARKKQLLEQEIKFRAEKAAQKEMIDQTAKKVTSSVRTIIMWAITVFCLLFSISSFGVSLTEGLLYIITGIFFALWAMMACPIITEKTKNLEQLTTYYKYKKVIVTLSIILLLILIVIM